MKMDGCNSFSEKIPAVQKNATCNFYECFSSTFLCTVTGFCYVHRFKTPLVRGEPSTQLDQFKKIEALISSDLDHWLCNLYFQVCVQLRNPLFTCLF